MTRDQIKAELRRSACEDENAPVSGWDDGLSQDYCRELGQWFADRLGAREELRRLCEERKE